MSPQDGTAEHSFGVICVNSAPKGKTEKMELSRSSFIHHDDILLFSTGTGRPLTPASRAMKMIKAEQKKTTIVMHF